MIELENKKCMNKQFHLLNVQTFNYLDDQIKQITSDY